jgi:hypothetical protein
LSAFQFVVVACSILLVDELVVRSGSMHPRIASVFRDDPHSVDHAGDVAEDRQDDRGIVTV